MGTEGRGKGRTGKKWKGGRDCSTAEDTSNVLEKQKDAFTISLLGHRAQFLGQGQGMNDLKIGKVQWKESQIGGGKDPKKPNPRGQKD